MFDLILQALECTVHLLKYLHIYPIYMNATAFCYVMQWHSDALKCDSSAHIFLRQLCAWDLRDFKSASLTSSSLASKYCRYCCGRTSLNPSKKAWVCSSTPRDRRHSATSLNTHTTDIYNQHTLNNTWGGISSVPISRELPCCLYRKLPSMRSSIQNLVWNALYGQLTFQRLFRSILLTFLHPFRI